MGSGGAVDGRGVGRSHELAAAAFARDTARSGLGSVLAVTGAPGSGKTWLCEAIAESAAGEGFQVGWGSAWPGGGVPPLWPWRQALGALDETPEGRALFDAPPEPDHPDWFARCVAVVDHLRALAGGRPTLLVLDDVHDADEATRRLAWFVARHVRGLPLVLVVAHGPGDGLAELDAEATVVALHGLSPTDAAALLAARGIEGLSDDDLAFVVDATGGSPAALHRLATAAGDPTGLVGTLVDGRLAELPADVTRSAALLAVAGPSVRLGEVAGLGLDAFAVGAELERRGLARRGPAADALSLSHERVRAALVATLDPDEVLDVHARQAEALAALPPTIDRLERRAEHALAATARPGADAAVVAQAVGAVQEAAEALVGDNQPTRAAELLAAADAAHGTAGLGDPPAALLAARGAALLRCGLLAAARGEFRRAVAAAEAEGDACSFARAALGLGGVWLVEVRSPIERERYLQLLERAQRGLPDDAVALRLRLDVRHAAEVAYETGYHEEIEALVAAAREHGDPALLTEALSLYHYSMLGPVHRDKRANAVHEMVLVATRADDHAAALLALYWLTVDQFLAGDPRAERSLRELEARAAAEPGHHVAYLVQVMDAMLLQRHGRLEEAERAAAKAFATGSEVGDADAEGYHIGLLVTLRWIQGRSAEVLDLAAAADASPTVVPANRAFTATLATLAATCGEVDRARAVLSRLNLRTVHQDSGWLVTLFAVVEAAYLLGDAELAGAAAGLMAPYADLPVLGSLGVTCGGSVRRSLGLAAVTAGEVDRGIDLLEQATADNERLGNRPLAAMTAVDLARARARRGRPGDPETAVGLLDRAVREADAMGLARRVDEWRALRDRLAGGVVAPAPEHDDGARPAQTAVPLEDAPGTIRRRGRSWVLAVAGREAVVPDLLGMTYLVQLLTNPGVEIAAAALVADGSEESAALAGRPEQPLLDDAALAAYRRRVTELEDDLAEAERHADPERAARARVELDAVVDELTRATNRFGRPRRFSSTNERARTAVQKAVRRSLDSIDEADPALGAVLRRSVRTGRTCCYEPGPDAPATWTRT